MAEEQRPDSKFRFAVDSDSFQSLVVQELKEIKAGLSALTVLVCHLHDDTEAAFKLYKEVREHAMLTTAYELDRDYPLDKRE